MQSVENSTEHSNPVESTANATPGTGICEIWIASKSTIWSHRDRPIFAEADQSCIGSFHSVWESVKSKLSSIWLYISPNASPSHQASMGDPAFRKGGIYQGQ
eukprot:Gregarina_sp_Poly_1__9297@NODE_576_length_7467_cov_130_013649_g450_i0_p9_GENE_NODE_576_length_7467_cov_130_013649_g450_i0NODE_576_length_7467_cov_130_013649_g450_i0_p9_ORF_typecomplete_len102_score5_46_NODE_576_length_7467_cov_130_013649_g450_i019542259